MFGPKQYAAIYYGFKDEAGWFAAIFAKMTRKQFNAFVEFCFSILDPAAEREDTTEFCRVKGLLLAIALKKLESSYFEDDLTIAQRVAARNSGTSYYELARSLYPLEQQETIEEAWLSSLDYGELCGYQRIRVFKMLSPHRVFRDPTQAQGSVSTFLKTA
jgi:hypothetical protein